LALLNDLVLIAFTLGTIGIALKFASYFNEWVYFPSLPNVFDSAFLIIAVLYFSIRALIKSRKRNCDG
jgi:hypothetical protein